MSFSIIFDVALACKAKPTNLGDIVDKNVFELTQTLEEVLEVFAFLFRPDGTPNTEPFLQKLFDGMGCDESGSTRNQHKVSFGDSGHVYQVISFVHVKRKKMDTDLKSGKDEEMKLMKPALAWLFICSHDPRRLSFIWPTTIVITKLVRR